MILTPEGGVSAALWTPPDKDGGQASVLTPSNVDADTVAEAIKLAADRLKREVPE